MKRAVWPIVCAHMCLSLHVLVGCVFGSPQLASMLFMLCSRWPEYWLPLGLPAPPTCPFSCRSEETRILFNIRKYQVNDIKRNYSMKLVSVLMNKNFRGLQYMLAQNLKQMFKKAYFHRITSEKNQSECLGQYFANVCVTGAEIDLSEVPAISITY